jgi:3-phenylpropionate/trans-cinnamate dioxygenase ferredoxin reductase subunit
MKLDHDATVAVVGASLAGLRTAEALRSEGFAGRLVLICDELHLPYDRPPLSKQVLAGTWAPERAVLADRVKLDEHRIDLKLGCAAVALDAEATSVDLADGTVVKADAVVVATGARPRHLPGTEGMPGVHVLRTLDDSEAIRRRVLEVGTGCRVVVVGAGFIGSEVASTCADLGCAVTVLEALATPLETALGPEIGAACAELHGRHGVDLRTSTGVAAVRPGDEGDGAPLMVELTTGGVVAADIVAVGIGVTPATDWLAGSGLKIDNGVHCDSALFAADRVVAAGDLARWQWQHDGFDEPVRIEHWQLAAEMGVAAARSLMAGREAATPFDPVPYFWSDQYGVRIQMLGRPLPTDEVEIVQGSAADSKFLALYRRNDRLGAALAIAMPRPLMMLRPLLAAGASWSDAMAVAAG